MCLLFHLAKISFGTSADVFVDICHITDALITSFPRSLSTVHFTCVLYSYNSSPSNHSYFAMLTHGKNQANPSSGDDASAVGTGRASRKKILTEKGQAFYSATSAVSTTVAVSAVAASVAIDSASAKEGTRHSAHAREATSALAASVAVCSSPSKEGTSSCLAVSRSAAIESAMLDNSNLTRILVDGDLDNADGTTTGDLDNADTMTASFNVSAYLFQLRFDCICVIYIRYELYPVLICFFDLYILYDLYKIRFNKYNVHT